MYNGGVYNIIFMSYADYVALYSAIHNKEVDFGFIRLDTRPIYTKRIRLWEEKLYFVLRQDLSRVVSAKMIFFKNSKCDFITESTTETGYTTSTKTQGGILMRLLHGNWVRRVFE